jgi:hypothetical protein
MARAASSALARRVRLEGSREHELTRTRALGHLTCHSVLENNGGWWLAETPRSHESGHDAGTPPPVGVKATVHITDCRPEIGAFGPALFVDAVLVSDHVWEGVDLNLVANSLEARIG